MEERTSILHSQEQPCQAPTERPAKKHHYFSLKLSKWRAPPVGYIVCPFLIGIALLITYINHLFTLQTYLTGSPFFLATIVIAWLWGIGPALLAIILGILALDTFIITPWDLTVLQSWNGFASYTPFIVAQLVVILITVLREKSRQRALLAAEQEARARAQELAELNQALVQSNQQLDQANKLKDYFLSQASHELKTPVTTIRGQAQLALRRLAKSQQTVSEHSSWYACLEKIDAQTHRLQELIDNLLDMSRLSSGKAPLRLAPCDLGNLCREVAADQQMLSGRCLELELLSDPITLQADEQRLSQVIINLVSNAVKYSLENTIVSIVVQQEFSHVTLSVHNDGSVIKQEQHKYIFEPFYRTPEAQCSSKQGWGLGLSICKEIVERHAGQIWVELSEEKGTTFFVQLPLLIENDV